MNLRTRPLCNDGYAVLASGLTKGPLWSAERLTAQGVRDARSLQRRENFHPDMRLEENDRSELSDYRGSGFDRGHMTPSGDAATADAQEATFEESVRNLAERDGEVFVVTGPAFEGASIRWIGEGKVFVPTATWKAIADPALRRTGAWICTNENTPQCRVLSVSELRTITHVEPFPALDGRDEDQAMDLPAAGTGRYVHIQRDRYRPLGY
jgi:endonuclease G